MQAFALTFTLLLLSGPAFSVPVKNVGNAIDNLIKAAIEYVRYELEAHDPLLLQSLFDLPAETIINDPAGNIFLNATTPEIYITNATNFVLKNIENDLDAFWGKFEVFLPTLADYGTYTIVGSAIGHDVEGAGTFSGSVTNLDVTGFFQMELVDHYVQIQYMNLTYTIEGTQFEIQNITVSGVSPEEVKRVLDNDILSYLQQNMPLVCEKVSRQITLEGNAIMKGKTLLEIIDWLKNFVGTTTPPSIE